MPTIHRMIWSSTGEYLFFLSLNAFVLSGAALFIQTRLPLREPDPTEAQLQQSTPPLSPWRWRQVLGATLLAFVIILIFLPLPGVIVFPVGLAVLTAEIIWVRPHLTPKQRKRLRMWSLTILLASGVTCLLSFVELTTGIDTPIPLHGVDYAFGSGFTGCILSVAALILQKRLPQHQQQQCPEVASQSYAEQQV